MRRPSEVKVVETTVNKETGEKRRKSSTWSIDTLGKRGSISKIASAIFSRKKPTIGDGDNRMEVEEQVIEE